MNEADKLFEDIRYFVENGGDINAFYKDKSVLYQFLETYYQLVVYPPIAEDDWTDDEEEFAEELLLPLAQREHSIAEQMQWLLEHGADTNAGGDYPPLISAVAYLDYAMTEWLLEHGANPHFDLDEDGDIPYGCGNYYIDDLDVKALHYSFETNAKKEIFDLILKMATLFAKHGVTDVHTHCISIDAKTRTVTLTQARVKF